MWCLFFFLMFKDRICRLGAGIFPGRGSQIYWVSCLFFYIKKKGVIKFLTMSWWGTNLLLVTLGPISNVWSIKPNFKFKTPKCDQIFPCGAFFDFVAGRITCTTCNIQHTGRRQSHNCNKNLTGLSMCVCVCGGGVIFSGGGGHRFLNVDDV